jgi:hypothetical protein
VSTELQDKARSFLASTWPDLVVVIGVFLFVTGWSSEHYSSDEQPWIVGGATLTTVGLLALVKRLVTSGDRATKTLLFALTLGLCGLLALVIMTPSAPDYSSELSDLDSRIENLDSSLDRKVEDVDSSLTDLKFEVSRIESEVDEIRDRYLFR